jgi:hypothetical protein
MKHYIGIAMPYCAFAMRDIDAADPELTTFRQFVKINAGADAV